MIKLNGATFSEGQDKARAALASKARHVCIYGGARAGKTFLIVRAIVHRALRAPNSRHAILRHRANAARSSISLDTIPKVMRTCFPGVRYDEKRQDGYFELPNGSQLWVGGLDDGNRIEKILGQEFCVDPDSRVLTANLDWVAAKDLKVHDEVIGFDEDLNSHVKLESSFVTRHSIINAPRVRIVTDRGETVVSANHKFVTLFDDRRNRNATQLSWREAQQLHVGSRVRFAKAPWERGTSFDDGWFSGMLDGEGWVTPPSSGVAQNEGDCLDAMVEWLDANKVEYNDYIMPTKYKTNKICHQLRFRGLWETLRVLGICKPKRNDGRNIWEDRRAFTAGNHEATVLSVEYLGVGPVVSMETTSRTFISDGFLSHNCTIYLNEASQISYESVLVVLTRLAQVCRDENDKEVRQRFVVDLNPCGKTHWTNMMFVQGLDPQSRRPLLNPEDYAYARLNPVDNAHNLSAEYLNSLKNLPEKARRRFYDGLFVDEVEGALWTYDILDKCRREPDDIPVDRRRQVVVGVDPSGASGDNPDADPIGIILGARDPDDHGYILADESLLAGPSGPNGWAAKVCRVFRDNLADYVVAERNFGGEMVRSVIHAQDSSVPVHLVTASRGKAVRAEPVSTLYGQGRVHHVGRFETLEDQMCAFTSSGYNGPGSPDHADAAVWVLTDLLLGNRAAQASVGRYHSRMF